MAQGNKGGNPAWVKGGPSPNPSGTTPEVAQARQIVLEALASAPFTDAWKSGYLKCLMEGNPVVLKDMADRVAGKAKDVVEASDALQTLLRTLLKAPTEEQDAVAEQLENLAK